MTRRRESSAVPAITRVPGSVLVAWYPTRPDKVRLLATQGVRFVRVSSSGSDGGSYVTGVAIRPSWSVRIGTWR